MQRMVSDLSHWVPAQCGWTQDDLLSQMQRLFPLLFGPSTWKTSGKTWKLCLKPPSPWTRIIRRSSTSWNFSIPRQYANDHLWCSSAGRHLCYRRPNFQARNSSWIAEGKDRALGCFCTSNCECRLISSVAAWQLVWQHVWRSGGSKQI